MSRTKSQGTAGRIVPACDAPPGVGFQYRRPIGAPPKFEMMRDVCRAEAHLTKRVRSASPGLFVGQPGQ